MRRSMLNRTLAIMLTVALLAAACFIGGENGNIFAVEASAAETESQYTLDMTASINAEDSSLIDVVITAKDFKQELLAVEFNLNFDNTLVEGVVTENANSEMDVFMTTVPTYIFSYSGIETAAPSFEQICFYDGENGRYECRFCDLLLYPYAKPGQTIRGLMNDGDLVITIQFRIRDGVAPGTEIPFSITNVYGTTSHSDGVNSVPGTPAAAKTVLVPEETPTYTCELNNLTVSCDAEIIMQLKVIIPEDVVNAAGAYAVLTKNNATTTRIPMTEIKASGVDAKGRYTLEQGIASGEMTYDVKLEIFDGNGNQCKILDYATGETGDSVSRIVLDYARLALEKGNDKLKTLTAAMLTYGGYAQQYFGKDTANPAYNILAEFNMEVPSIAGINADTITQSVTTGGSSIGLTYRSQSPELASRIANTVYFNLADGASINDYTFILTYTEGGVEKTKELEPVLNSKTGAYGVEIEDIPAAYLDYMYKITVTKNATGETYEVTTSIMAWVKSCLSASTNEKLNNLAKAMYLYNQAANAYFNK